jgi:tetratricopeptide (TPR) repeat protein
MKTRIILVITLALSSMSMCLPQAASARTIQLDNQAPKKLQAQIRGTPRPEVIDAARRYYEQQQREAEAWARSPHNLENQDPEIRGLGRFDRYLFYFNRGKEKHDKNDFQGAMSDYNKAIYCYPDHSQVYNNRGVLKEKFNDFAGALEDYNLAERLVVGRGTKATILYNRGTLKIRMNDRAGAIQDLRQAARWYQQEGKTQYYQETLNELRSINATL